MNLPWDKVADSLPLSSLLVPCTLTCWVSGWLRCVLSSVVWSCTRTSKTVTLGHLVLFQHQTRYALPLISQQNVLNILGLSLFCLGLHSLAKHKPLTSYLSSWHHTLWHHTVLSNMQKSAKKQHLPLFMKTKSEDRLRLTRKSSLTHGFGCWWYFIVLFFVIWGLLMFL